MRFVNTFAYWRLWRQCSPAWHGRVRRRPRWPWSFRSDLLHRSCLCTSSQFAQEKATSGRQDIGHGTTTIKIIIGCLEPGWKRHEWDIYGHQDIGLGGDAYVFHVGYWGPVVGFYGGIDYGYGYVGRGYYGGRWTAIIFTITAR